MNVAVLTHVRRLFRSGIRHIDRHNQRAWVMSVRFLGKRWLLSERVRRIVPNPTASP